MSATWHFDVIAASHTAVLAEIDAQGSAAYVTIHDVGDVLLSTLPLTYPAGSVGVTGILTLTFGARDDAASASGTATYGILHDALGKDLLVIDVVESATSVIDNLALTTTTIVLDQPVEGISFTIGA